MNKKNFLFLVATLLFSITSYAGYVQPAPVEITLTATGGSAQGDVITARNSDNEFAAIGCGIRAYDDGAGGAWHWGFCQVQTEENNMLNCQTQNAELLTGIGSVSDSSFISFSWTDDGTGNLTCTRVGSSTQSFYLQKGQKSK